MTIRQSRREFLKAMGIATAAISMGGCNGPLNGDPNDLEVRSQSGSGSDSNGNSSTPMPKRWLGNTGVQVSVLGLGGEAGVESSNQSVATSIVNAAIDGGVNYIDTSPLYGGSRTKPRYSEINIGEVMKTRRDEVFLATKTGVHWLYDETTGAIEDLLGKEHDINEPYDPDKIGGSLGRLQTDHVDLLQIHNIQEYETGGSKFWNLIDEAEQLRQHGWVKYIGISGHHNPEMLLEWIQAYQFDTIMLSLNAADIHYKPFQIELLEAAVAQGLGILGMKVFGGRHGDLADPDNPPSDYLTSEQLLYYVLSFPISCAVVGCDNASQASEDCDLVKSFGRPYNSAELQAIEAKTVPAGPEPEDNGEPAWEGNWFKEGLREY